MIQPQKPGLLIGDPAGTTTCGADLEPCSPVDITEVVFDHPPDLAGWQDVFWVVNRNLGNGVDADGQMHFFNNNLIRPSGYAGMHPQLVHYDITKGDGV